jgi:hypothetical protein
VQRIGDGQAQVGYSVAERSRGRVILCVVCTMHKETGSTSFLVQPQNQGQRVFQFEPQNRQLWFDDFAHKITDGFLVWFSKPRGSGLSVCTSKPISR